MPIAVIVGGKLTSQVMRLQAGSRSILRIVVPPVIDVRATDDEVIFGFSGFIIMLLTIGLPFGHRVYDLFRLQYGIDPGAFNSLCVMSSFANVLLAMILFLFSRLRRAANNPRQLEYEKKISELPKIRPGENE